MDDIELGQWRQRHYEVEKEYARQILLTPKGSVVRRQLLSDAYSDVIGNIIQAYDPGGSETNDSIMVAGIVKSLLQSNSKDCKTSKFFDLGCGGGNLLAALAADGFDVYGVDPSQDSVARAKEKLAKFGMAEHVSHGDFIDYTPTMKFDAIVMDNVIEHIVPDEIPDVLAKCCNMLNRGGALIVITPHLFSGPHDISSYFVPLGGRAEGFHLKEFSFTDLKNSLLDSGFDDVLGFMLHPRLLKNAGVSLKPSEFAAWKCRVLEALAKRWPFRAGLKINQTLSRMIVALSFPAIAVGVKR